MKIFYAVQATGNGHISRAMELLPYLERYGKVDLFLSGANSSLSLQAPVKYRSKGLSLFYTCDGSLDYKKTFASVSPFRIFKEVKELPVENYDLILNDFDCITSMACARKKLPSVNFGHQASFLSEKTPRPSQKSKVGEWVLKNYAKASQHFGLHFQPYDDFIYSPVIKQAIVEAEAKNLGHITVYLPSFCEAQLKKIFEPFKDYRFEIFSFQTKFKTVFGHLSFLPVDKKLFNQSLIDCYGIITGGGFETPAEALFLKKKILSIPIRGQYEQNCNAAALRQLGVPVLEKIDDNFNDHFNNWVNNHQAPDIRYQHDTASIVETLMLKCTKLQFELDITYPDLIFN